MTVETQARTTSDIVSDGITEFAITYPFHFASDLRVTHVVGTVVTVLTLDLDWTAVPNDQLTGGTLTLLTGFSEGKIETERRVIAYQSINTTETRTLRAAATERQLDRMVMSFLDAQGQSSALLSRAVVAPHGMPGPVLSDLLADGDTLMISGNEIVKGPSASDISLAQAHAEDAADAAASAIAAQAAAEAAADSLDVGNFYSKAEVDALQAAQDAVVAALTLDVADAISDVATISGDVAALEAGSAALDGRLDILEERSEWVSSGQYALVNNGDVYFAHGLGAIPSSIEAYYVCTTANNGYAVGETVGPFNTVDYAAAYFGCQVTADATNVRAHFAQTAGAIIMDRSTGAPISGGAPAASWRLVLRARK